MLYAGSLKVKVSLDDVLFNLKYIPSSSSLTSGVVLKTSDNYILKDSNGLYLTAREVDI